MNKQMAEVMQRRGELLARIAAQRAQVAGIAMHWQAPLALADKGLSAIRFLRAKPILVAVTVAIFVARRRGMAGMVATGWRMWRLYRSALSFTAQIAPRFHR